MQLVLLNLLVLALSHWTLAQSNNAAIPSINSNGSLVAGVTNGTSNLAAEVNGTTSPSLVANETSSELVEFDEDELDEFDLPPNDEARLMHRLVDRYKGYGLARPVAEVGKTLNVSLLFFINEFMGIEELNGVMKVTATVVAQWQDDLLRWNPNEFNDLMELPVRTKDIFMPTIVKDGNGGTQASIFMTGTGQNERDINSMVWVRNDGTVEAKVTNNYRTSCTLNLDNFPFDEQTCYFTFKAWRFSDKRVTLHQSAGQKLSEHFGDSMDVNINANANWMMVSVTSEDMTIPGIGENFSAISYTVIAARRSDYYTWNILMPSIAMAVLLLATFFMPFGPDRSMFCITMVLTMNIFQQALTKKLPVTAEVIPYVRQTAVQVIMGVFITIESAFVWWLAAKDKRMAVPGWLRVLIPKLRKKIQEEQADEEKKEVQQAKDKMAKEYKNRSENNLSVAMGASMGTSVSRTSMGSLRHRLHGVADFEPAEAAYMMWGEWLEVAQLVDMLMLAITFGAMFLLPVYFYRHIYYEKQR